MLETTLFDTVARPPQSLGILEKQARKITGLIGHNWKPHHIVFCADNGIYAQGVSEFPQIVTYLQAKATTQGKSTVANLCRFAQIPYSVIDMGINAPEPVGMNFKVTKNGTKDFTLEPAMSQLEYNTAFYYGKCVVTDMVKNGHNILSFGEIGLGNTTTSAAVLSSISGFSPQKIVGMGTATKQSTFQNKLKAIQFGLDLNGDWCKTPPDSLRCFGGFDLVAMYASMLSCAVYGIPFMLDGFISAVAYACAFKTNRHVKNYCIPTHISRERGMSLALNVGMICADDVPLHANMALGEGSGAVMGLNLLMSILYATIYTARLEEVLGQK